MVTKTSTKPANKKSDVSVNNSRRAQENREAFWCNLELLEEYPILPDETIKQLLKMYWVTDVCKATGLNSPAIRQFVTHETRALSAVNSRILSQFLYTHYRKLNDAFKNDPIAFVAKG